MTRDKKDNKEMLRRNHKWLQSEANKIQQFFEVAAVLGQEKIEDRDLKFMNDFFKGLPAFQGKFDNLDKREIRQCLEKMSIQVYERSNVLYSQGSKAKYAYLIILGTVNIYDENIANDIKLEREQPTKPRQTS